MQYSMEYLKKLCHEKKITYKKLSEDSNIPEGTIKGIFSGIIKDPRISTYFGIINALNIDDNNLIQPLSPVLTDEEKELLDLYRNILPEVRQGVLTMLRGMNGTRTNKYKEVK